MLNEKIYTPSVLRMFAADINSVQHIPKTVCCPPPKKISTNESIIDSDKTSEMISDAEEEGSEASQDKRISMTVNDQKLIIVLYDTPESAALYNMLPLELHFEDYNSVEKIAYLPEELPVTDKSVSYDPNVGDLCLYAPWGNLSLFYEDFRLSNGLISLGHIESGLKSLSALDDFEVILDKEK